MRRLVLFNTRERQPCCMGSKHGSVIELDFGVNNMLESGFSHNVHGLGKQN